jgi:ABC-type multidrug transport system fused ATPase/permease subunit
MQNVFSGESGLLKDHTRVLVTHAIDTVKAADKIIVMKDGEIKT